MTEILAGVIVIPAAYVALLWLGERNFLALLAVLLAVLVL